MELEAMFKQAYMEGLKQGENLHDINPELITQKELAENVLHVSVHSVDKYFTSEPDFPFVMVGSKRRYYVPAVHKWLMNHQVTMN